VKLAYADPPYLGQCARYGHDHREPYGCWDRVEAHTLLLDHLETTYDGWAMSASSSSLHAILREGVRVAAWCKPNASAKPNVRPTYAWEPVLFVPARRLPLIVNDWLVSTPVMWTGFHGAKSVVFMGWVLQLLGAEPDDEVVDLFHGSGAASRAIDVWRQSRSLWDAVS